jgi:hypothetical protein
MRYWVCRFATILAILMVMGMAMGMISAVIFQDGRWAIRTFEYWTGLSVVGLLLFCIDIFYWIRERSG